MTMILELRTDQGGIVTRSFQDPALVFYVEHASSAPVVRKSFGEIQIGDRVAAEPRHFMELVNARTI